MGSFFGFSLIECSTAINNIISMVLDEVISMEDLDEFSDELKETVKYAVKKKEYRHKIYSKAP